MSQKRLAKIWLSAHKGTRAIRSKAYFVTDQINALLADRHRVER